MGVVLWDINVTKRRQNNEPQSENYATKWTLDDYYKIAQRCIGAFAAGSLAKAMMRDEDAISFVAENLMYGAHRWNGDKGRTLHCYLNQCAIWCIYRWVKLTKRSSTQLILSLDEDVFTDSRMQMHETIADEKSAIDKTRRENIAELTHVIDRAGLTDRQMHCIEVVYIQGQRPAEVARDLGVSPQAIDQCLAKGIRKIQVAIHGTELPKASLL